MDLIITYTINDNNFVFKSQLKNFNIAYAKNSEQSRCFLRCSETSNLNELIIALKDNAIIQNLTILNNNVIVYENTDWTTISDIAIDGDESHIIKTIVLSL